MEEQQPATNLFLLSISQARPLHAIHNAAPHSSRHLLLQRAQLLTWARARGPLAGYGILDEPFANRFPMAYIRG